MQDTDRSILSLFHFFPRGITRKPRAPCLFAASLLSALLGGGHLPALPAEAHVTHGLQRQRISESTQ
jgi:hypothetical protein